MATRTSDSLIEELKRDAEKGELLLWAAARGLSADVVELVQTGADPAAKDKRGRQAVHYAASNGHLDILEFLFTKGVLLDAEDDVGRGALHYAAAGGHTTCVSYLLGKECWRDAPDAVDDTPLHLAARHGGLAAVKALTDAGAKLLVYNKRSLTPFAEAVLAGRLPAAEALGSLMPGGLAGALAATYRELPLLHLAAGMGQAAAVEWLIRQQRCDLATTATDQGYTPLHAAALSGDEGTVTTLLKLGADPLGQTRDGKLPLELVPRAAPSKSAPPPPPPSALPPPPPEEGPSSAAAAAADPDLLRSARRAFKALVAAAAERSGVDMEREVRARKSRTRGSVGGSVKAAAGTLASATKRGKKKTAEGVKKGRGELEEEEEDDVEEEEEEEEGGSGSPAAVFLRQFLGMSEEQQVAKVEAYARMNERQVSELSYMDTEAQAAVTALRQAMGMVELFGAIAALRADEDFQSDIRDPRVRDALADAKRTNNLERYEDQAAVMSVANKFKRLHAVSHKAGGLQVVIDDLRSELPGNDPASTAAKMEEMRAAQGLVARNAVQAVLSSASAAVPERLRLRILNAQHARSTTSSKAAQTAQTAGKGAAAAAAAAAGKAGGQGAGGSSKAAGPGISEIEAAEDSPLEDAATFKARMAQKARMDKLRAAATSAWSARSEMDEAIGYVDGLEKEYEKRGAKTRTEEGAKVKRRWWRQLSAYLGEELAQSLQHTLRGLLLTLAAFAVMWLFGLMPHQQSAALQARLEEARRAAEALAAAAAGGGLAAAAVGAAGGGLEGLEGQGAAIGEL